VDSHPLKREQAEALASLYALHFLNRDDVVAHKAEWGSDCPLRASGILNQLFLSHLLGERLEIKIEATWFSTSRGMEGKAYSPFRVGTYSPDLDGMTFFCCLDFDGGGQPDAADEGSAKHKRPLADPLAAALRVLAALREVGLVCYLERSKSGSGWHVWVLFACKVPAAVVRRAILSLIPKDIPLADGKGVAVPGKNVGIELFPKQNSLTHTQAKLGNMVYLPMWAGATYPNNCFHEVNDQGEVQPFLPLSFEVNPALAIHALDPGEKPARFAVASAPRVRPPAAAGEDRRSLCVNYLRRCDPAVSGRGGHGRLFWAARVARWGWGLTDDESFRVIREVYDPICDPPWSEGEIRHKIADAGVQGDFRKPYEWLLDGHRAYCACRRSRRPRSRRKELQEGAPEGGEGPEVQGEVTDDAAPDPRALLAALAEQAQADPEAALDAALQADNLAALVETKLAAPAELEALYRALEKAGAKARAVERLLRAVNAEAKAAKRQRQEEARQRARETVASPDSPVLANYREQEVAGGGDGDETRLIRIGLPAPSIAQDLLLLTGGWPKAVNNDLFVPGPDCKPSWLTDSAKLFGHIQATLPSQTTNVVRWAEGSDMVSQSVFHAALPALVERYVAVEPFPHYPPIAGHYYMHAKVEGGCGKALRALVKRFNPATPIDEDLIEAFFVTLFWGGAYGQRPAWLFTGEEDDELAGRGVGKSTVPKMGARLLHGSVAIDQDEKMSDVVKRLLSPEGMTARLVLLDNLKALKFSWGQLEALITAAQISGHRLYQGEGRRPNTLTAALTLNGAALSRDMAQRCVIVKVARPTYSASWEEETAALIDERRWEIVGDCLAWFQKPATVLTRHCRWSAWEDAVLARVAEPADCQKVIEERQNDVDEDTSESDLVRDWFVKALRGRRHSPDLQRIFIPSRTAGEWTNIATGERRPINRATGYLNQLKIKEIRKSADNGARGFTWTGKSYKPSDKPDGKTLHLNNGDDAGQ
jgi:hypothetical protein